MATHAEELEEVRHQACIVVEFSHQVAACLSARSVIVAGAVSINLRLETVERREHLFRLHAGLVCLWGHFQRAVEAAEANMRSIKGDIRKYR